MERGLVAPLSPNEDTTLRRIAHGMVGTRDLKKQDIDHLMALELVRVSGNVPALTALGQRRLSACQPLVGEAALKDDEHVAALAKALGVKR